jgi:DNA-binding LacI/PurR family transcriptional regulator
MSISEVAKAANVSPATVSRVLNQSRSVSPEKVGRIQAAMAELGYSPGAVRPGPKSADRRGVQTGNVLLLSIGQFSVVQMLNMPALPMLLGGAQEALGDRGMNVIFAHCRDGCTVPQALSPKSVDGVLVIGYLDQLSTAFAKRLEQLPLVWLLHRSEQMSDFGGYIRCDNEQVGELAGEYLAGQGHKETAVLTRSPGHSVYTPRVRRFAASVRRQGSNVIELTGQHRYDPSQPPAAFVPAAIDRLLEQTPQVTGLFCVSDYLMLAAHCALLRRGVEPGRDVTLIGCDNDPQSMSQMYPRPATIDIQLTGIGREGVNRLMAQINDPSETASKPSEVIYPPKLV